MARTAVVAQTAQDAPDWRAAMEAVADEDGYLERLGAKHHAFFAETGSTLIVTFERAEDLRAREGQMPALWSLVQEKGWSLLTILAEGETFWRGREVWGYFDRLADDAFFEDFDRVLFYGAGPAGYAAASYMVTAPAARALLIAPIATQDPAIAGWDRRHLAARRFDFNSRYGYAPDMTDGAEKLWLLYDPLVAADAGHAALYRKAWTQYCRMPHLGAEIESILAQSPALHKLVSMAVEGTLTPQQFAKFWRNFRRRDRSYLRNILARAHDSGHPKREILICQSVTRRFNAPRYAKRLAQLQKQSDS